MHEFSWRLTNHRLLPPSVVKLWISSKIKCTYGRQRSINNLNENYEWIIDLDIENFFDTVNHDELISIFRENVKDVTTL